VHGPRAIVIFLVAAAFVVSFATLLVANAQSPEPIQEWQKDWGLQQGFNIEIDAQEFRFPTSIAFVPHPGDSAKDPLYFVTELKGNVKVVTNDRSLFTFAENFFTLQPKRNVPAIDEEVGMAGICLDSEHGYVFVTFSYHDEDNILRNNIVRFQSTPERFSISPTSQLDFSDVFSPYRSIPSHQIGPCQVKDNLLYVNVADGGDPAGSQSLDSLSGKVLRMTLNGKPEPSNPFYQNDSINRAANFVWASGLRNPFGLALVGDQVFVADNGPDVDRFLEINEGVNYLWDGTNLSIGTNANALFSPGRGVAQLEYFPQGSTFFPDRFGDNFFLTMTGNPVRPREGYPAVWVIPYDLNGARLTGVPKALLRYRGSQAQVVSGLAFGPDGLYIAPLIPNKQGLTAVLKITFDPEAQYPFTLASELNPSVLMSTRGCFACHTLYNNDGGSVGPILDADALVPRVLGRLNSEEYAVTGKELDQLEIEPFLSFRGARDTVRQAQGPGKVKLWVQNKILEPRFDDPNAKMPRISLSEEQAASIATHLVGAQPPETSPESRGFLSRINPVGEIADFFQDRLPIANRANAKKFLAAFFGLGLFAGILGTIFAFWFLSRRRRRSGKSGSQVDSALILSKTLRSVYTRVRRRLKR
jgi:hypothetical protein